MNLFDLLKEHAGMSREEAEHYFRIENTATEYTMKSILYLEPTKFHAVLKLAAEYGGTYDPKAKGGIIHIPKESDPTSPEPRSDGKLEEALGHTPPSQESSEEYALSRSLKGKLGQLVPCLEDANGVMFDGFHRKNEDANAWTVKRDQIKTPVDRALARMAVNFCRRHYTGEEMKNDVGLLIGSGLKVEEIVETTGISKTTIYQYMPQEAKDKVKVEAGVASGIARTVVIGNERVVSVPLAEQTVKTHDTTQPEISRRIQDETLNERVECTSCHMAVHVSKATLVDNKYYCPQHASQAKTQPKGVPQVKEYKPKETPEFRRGVMSPGVSKTELAVLEELVKRGHKVQSQVRVCLFETVIDYVVDDGVPFYLDGKRVHQNRDWKDDFIREKLSQKLGRTVYAIPYEYFTQDAVKKIVDSMEEKT